MLSDDPRLTVRLPPGHVSSANAQQESNDAQKLQPIIFDTQLRMSVDCKLLRADTPMKPWLFCSESALCADARMRERRCKLEEAGARIFPVEGGQGMKKKRFRWIKLTWRAVCT